VQAQASCFVLGASCKLGQRQRQVRVVLSIVEAPGARPLRQQCYAGKGEGWDAEQPGVVHLVATQPTGLAIVVVVVAGWAGYCARRWPLQSL